MEDIQIIERYWARDEQALRETAEKYGSYCRAVAYGILRSDAESQECVNDAWLKAWESIPPHRPESLKAYLGKLVRNLALNRLQARSAQKRGGGQGDLPLDELAQCLPAPGGPEEAVELADLTALLDRFLDSLKADDRRIFLQRYWYFCTVKEIAQNLNLGESRVKMSLARSRQKLKKRLEEGGFPL